MLFLAKIFMYLLTAAVLSVIFVYSQDMPLAASIYPEVVAIIVGVLLVIEIIRAVPYGSGAADTSMGADIDLAEDEKTRWGMRKAGLVFGSIFLLLVGLYLFGFYITIPLFVFAYMLLEKESIFLSGIFAAVVGFINWYVFGELLSLPFPSGLLVG